LPLHKNAASPFTKISNTIKDLDAFWNVVCQNLSRKVYLKRFLRMAKLTFIHGFEGIEQD